MGMQAEEELRMRRAAGRDMEFVARKLVVMRKLRALKTIHSCLWYD